MAMSYLPLISGIVVALVVLAFAAEASSKLRARPPINRWTTCLGAPSSAQLEQGAKVPAGRLPSSKRLSPFWDPAMSMPY